MGRFSSLRLTHLAQSPAPVRIGVFVLTLLLLWLPIALPGYLLIADPNWQSIVTLAGLYLLFIGLARGWARRVYGESHIFRRYGLVLTGHSGRDLLLGLGLGLLNLLVLFGVQGSLGWVRWQAVPANFGQIVAEGLAIALAVGFAEELFFRGWLLDELARDYPPARSLWLNAVIFAILHLRLWQFPALTLLGATLVWARRGAGHLGLPIGLHAGLVWGYYLVNVGQLTVATARVPAWVTGLDGNPLVGALGLVMLGLLALTLQRWAARQAASNSPLKP